MANNKEAMRELWKKLEDSPFVMIGLEGQATPSEPMTAMFDAQHPNEIYFYTRKDNRLVQGLASGARVAVVNFEAKGHDLFACLHGRLRLCTSANLVEQFWSNAVEAWFEGGKQDPMLEMLCFDVEHAEVWLADLTVVGKVKMLFGAKIDRRQMEDRHVSTSL